MMPIFVWPPLIVGLLAALLGVGVILRRRASRARLAFAANQIIDAMADVVLVLDRNGTVCIANQGACRLSGKTERELVGRPVTALDHSFMNDEQWNTPLCDGVVWDQRAPFTSRPGAARILSISASCMRDQTQ